MRKRADTRTLLGDEFNEPVTEPLHPPLPLQNISGYDEKRLRKSLKYADFTLRNKLRKLSPIGTRALILYKDACARLLDIEEGDALDEDEEEVQEEWIAAVRTCEQSAQFTACFTRHTHLRRADITG